MVQSLQTNAGGLVEGLARYITNHARQRRRLRQSTLEVRGVIVQAVAERSSRRLVGLFGVDGRYLRRQLRGSQAGRAIYLGRAIPKYQ